MTPGLHVIVGLGVTGMSCARFLAAKQIPFALLDTRPNPPQLATFQEAFPDVPLILGGLDVELLSQAACIVLSPGIDPRTSLIAELARKQVPMVGDIELFARYVNAPVIAITGTNAKSTVTTLVGMMVKAAGQQVGVGGNLGVPALDLLLDQPDADAYVLELSSFQLETTRSLAPAVATVLNITPDHMDRYDTFEDYQAAKHRIYQHAKTIVCNRDDRTTWLAGEPSVKTYYFTLREPQANEWGRRDVKGEIYLAYGDQPLLPVKALPVPGLHYQANALAALAIGLGYGLSFEPMLKVLREFTGLPHRCQLVRERREVCWYNDSKGTNVGATQAAIEGLGQDIQGKLILIAGGVGKNADFTGLVPVLEKYVRHVVLIGEAADELAQVIGDRVPVSLADSMQAAILQADANAKPRDCVLLSPACASFDMFNNYEHRGNVFMECVTQLPAC